MLDVIVLLAMAVTAAAFAAGLIFQAGLALLSGLIAGAALFLVMAASYVVVARSRRSGGGDRLDELEEALEIIDNDLQRIDRMEDDVGRLDLLSDRVERLDQAFSEFVPSESPGGNARIEELAAQVENVSARLEGLRADVKAEACNQRDKIANDLDVLKDLITRLSRDLAGSAPAPAAAPSPAPKEPEELEAAPVLEIAEAKDEEEDEPAAEMETVVAAAVIEEFEEEESVELAAESYEDDDGESNDEMRRTVREAVDAGRVDLYVQPIVMLPERKIRYYEAITRIRTAEDDLVLPADYIPAAKRAGMMPLIDNVLLVKSVQVLRRLGPDSKVKGLFCNISMHSLLDPDFFPELVEFMEENSSLSESLIFEISQPEMLGLTRAELGCLDTLGALGYNFSLDHVSDLDVDFAALSDRYFRFVKIDAATFLHDMRMGDASQSAGDFKRQLDGLGIQLVVEKVEEEDAVAKLLDYGVELAQGYLFGKPKVMSPARSRELEDADAA
jgi:cyclic-di-GMP phosphodiesterase TipF (flagellum assembly factor)